MDKKTYLKNRRERNLKKKQYRNSCVNCWQPDFSCVCPITKAFDPNIKFVILTHPLEASKRIATGRIAYNGLKNSEFLRGYNFLHHSLVERLINDDKNHCFVLYPGPQAAQLNEMTNSEKKTTFDIHRQLVIFVIDGTWGNANKMLRLSPNLATLPKLCFTPTTPSRFRVRKQPKSFCLSTIEAIHFMIEQLACARKFDLSDKKHNNLLEIFNWLVEDQIVKIEKQKKNNGGLNHRSKKYLKKT